MADTITLAALAEALQIPAGELDKFRKDGDVDVTPEVFEKNVINHFKSHFTDSVERTKTGSWNDGFKAAERKVLTDKERAIKAKYPGIEGNTLEELVDNLATRQQATDWTKDPKVQGELNTREEKLRQLQKELEDAKLDKVRAVTSLKLEGTLPAVLSEKFEIPTDKVVAGKRLRLLMGELLQGGKIEVKEDADGKLVPWDTETNKRLQDSNYRDVGFDEWVASAASYIYNAKDGSGHRAPGNEDTPPKGPTGSGELAAIKTWDQVYSYKAGLDPRQKADADKLKLLSAHVAKLKESGVLKDS